jgi:hypothetical protein
VRELLTQNEGIDLLAATILITERENADYVVFPPASLAVLQKVVKWFESMFIDSLERIEAQSPELALSMYVQIGQIKQNLNCYVKHHNTNTQG